MRCQMVVELVDNVGIVDLYCLTFIISWKVTSSQHNKAEKANPSLDFKQTMTHPLSKL